MTAHDPQLQRSSGRAGVAFGPGAALRRLAQSGAAKAFVLDGPEVTFLNTAGGLAGGDHLRYALTLGDGVRAVATSQTAERVYRSTGPVARMDVRLDIGPGGHLAWLPQETILFDASRLARRTAVHLGPGASCLLAETLVLGRAAMGEAIRDVDLRDWREIRRDGAPVWVEPLRLTSDALGGLATLQDARAVCSVVLVEDGAADLLAALRGVLDEPGCRAAASALAGRLQLRILARDLMPLRRQLIRALAVLSRGRPLPRVWQV